MRKQSLIIGITGSIASGKSLVASAFEARGAGLVSADQLARDIVRPGSTVLEALAGRFGHEVLTSEGCLNRELLAQIVFADEKARADLNRIMHPAIGVLAVDKLQKLAVSGAPLVVYEAPLLFEAGAEDRVDQILVVTVDPEVQLQRLMARDGLSEADAHERISAQMTQEEKLARADYVIDNSHTIDMTMRQVDELWLKLVGGGAA